MEETSLSIKFVTLYPLDQKPVNVSANLKRNSLFYKEFANKKLRKFSTEFSCAPAASPRIIFIYRKIPHGISYKQKRRSKNFALEVHHQGLEPCTP